MPNRVCDKCDAELEHYKPALINISDTVTIRDKEYKISSMLHIAGIMLCPACIESYKEKVVESLKEEGDE